jgi:hypothetical protein
LTLVLTILVKSFACIMSEHESLASRREGIHRRTGALKASFERMEALVKDNADFTEAVDEVAEKMEMEQSTMMPEGNDRLREKLEMLEMLKDLEALMVQRGETEP